MSRRVRTEKKKPRPPRSPGRFKQTEVSRAIRSAREAGEIVERVDIDPTSGRISVVLAKPDAGGASELDSWLTSKREKDAHST